jgi:hypothetical protein
MVAGIVTGSERAVEVVKYRCLGVAFNRAYYYPDPLAGKKVLGGHTHAAGNYTIYSLLGQPRGEKSGLMFRRGNKLFPGYFFFRFIDVNQGKLLTMAEVRAHHPAANRYRVFHLIPPQNIVFIFSLV